MIVYSKIKSEFREDVKKDIEEILHTNLKAALGHSVGASERASYNALVYLSDVLEDAEIPEDCRVSLEYRILLSCKRVDVIISGSDGTNDNVIIIELKQWSQCRKTDCEGVVSVRYGHGKKEVAHPSYQAYSYACILKSFNVTIEKEGINVYPCAFLHNYRSDGVIDNECYSKYINEVPLFFKPDKGRLAEYIKKYIKRGDQSNIVGRIDSSELKPSKMLCESLLSMLAGNEEFVLVDDQKVVFEKAKKLALVSSGKKKNVMIVRGGAGSGKSVVAVNLLVKLNASEVISKYVTKTSAPRDVYRAKLEGEYTKKEFEDLFVGSGSFRGKPDRVFGALIVDEAHRLTEKTSYLKLGDNQIREIINASNFSIFFIDEDQFVHIDDYGKVDVIEKIAKECGARVHFDQLSSQFRCNGSVRYTAWLDSVLGKTKSRMSGLSKTEFDFQVKDSPDELKELIFERNRINNKARMVAGYCWDWKSKKDKNVFDIEITECHSGKECDFHMKWNLTSYGSKWIIAENSVSEIGCIHTSQGLEVDYIGVIIGPDFIVRDGKVRTVPEARSGMDKSILGYKKLKKTNPEYAAEITDLIIKNTYKTLMTRGMKGCYIYCADKETNEYFKKRLNAKSK